MHVLLCQARQPQRHDPGQAGEPVGRWRGRLALAHGGDHEHRQGRYGDGEVGEHGPGVSVRPVQVLEHQQARTPAPDEARKRATASPRTSPGSTPDSDAAPLTSVQSGSSRASAAP